MAKFGNVKLAIALVVTTALAACAHTKKPVLEATPGPTASADAQPAAGQLPAPSATNAAAPPSAVATAVTCSTDDACPSTQLCVAGTCVAPSASLAVCSPTVHFAFNGADLGEKDRIALQRAARCLEANANMVVTIQGNADERGTDQYNIALGARRANAVETYLTNLGVNEAQLQAVSFGKELPVCVEHDEACWSQNRRADVVPSVIVEVQALR
jgi:peptidoglycan-associated lipoprotein